MPAQDTRRRPPAANQGKRTEVAGHERVRLEISADHLCRLLETRQLCAADFRCLDGESRGCVRALCQKNCSRYLAGLAVTGAENPDVNRRDGGARKGGKPNRPPCNGGCEDCRKVSDGVYLTPFFLRKQAQAEGG